MSEPHLVVCNALVDAINGLIWSLSPLAVRRYVETLQTLEAEQLRVFVFPGDLSTEALSRFDTQEDHTTWLVVAQRVADAEPVTVDPLVEFARELRDAMRDASLPDAVVTNLETDAIYDFDALHKRSLFVQVFGVKWRWES
jgi:uncharacterized protein YjeT (DUF2065 family)